MLKTACMSVAFTIAAFGSITLEIPAQNTPPPATVKHLVIPAEASQRQNPVKSTEESLAKAKKIYKMDCAMCHGENGDGKGELAVSANFVIKDYRKPESLKGSTDGDIFYTIRTGFGNMPPEDERAKDADVWALVHYLRSFSGR